MGQDASNNFLQADMRQETPTYHHAKSNSFFVPSRREVNSAGRRLEARTDAGLREKKSAICAV
jgi:hypothetical protein